MDNQFAALKAAVTGAQQEGASPSPFGNYPEIAKFYSTNRALPTIRAAGNATANLSDQAAAQAQQQAAAKVQIERDMLDGAKYKQIPKQDGGYSFVAPNGQEISAYDYSRITGKPLDTVLKDSQNPIDQGFYQDYNNLQEYLKAWVNKDQKKIDSIQSANPELKTIQDPGELTGLFRQHYPTVFGGTQNGNQPVNSTYVPNSAAQVSNADYALTNGATSLNADQTGP